MASPGECSKPVFFFWHWPAADKTEEGLRNLASFFPAGIRGIVEKFLPLWGLF
jgi:hypothetical protein